MKKLDDLSVFHNQKARVFHRGRTFSGYEYGKRPETDQISFGESAFKGAIFCRLMGPSKLNEFFFQRRLRQDFLSMEYIYSGEFYVRSGKTGYIAEPGDLCLLQPGIDNDLLYLPGTPCRKFGLIIDGEKLTEVLHLFQLDRRHVLKFPDQGKLDGVFERLRESLLHMEDYAFCAQNTGCCFELLQILSEVGGEPAADGLAGVLDRLENSYMEKLNMGQLAVEFGMSLPVMNRLFRTAHGVTPYRYLMKVRMGHAALLLRETDKTVKEIAVATGGGHPLHFSTEFRRFHGCSPREFRKQ